MRSILAVGLVTALLFQSTSHAANPILIGASDQTRYAVSAGTGNVRVGNAVAARVLRLDKGMGIAIVVLLGCDGGFVTDGFQFAFKSDEDTNFANLESHAKSSEDQVPLTPIDLVGNTRKQQTYAPFVIKAAGQICKVAGREPKNMLVPIASFGEDDDQGAVVALVTGTSAKKGDVVDLWFRTSWYKKVPLLLKDGTPWEFEGVVQKKKEATGKHTLHKIAFDCKNGLTAVYEEARYEAGKSTPTTTSIPRDKIAMRGPIPNSVGEAQLEWVCRLYGDRAKD